MAWTVGQENTLGAVGANTAADWTNVFPNGARVRKIVIVNEDASPRDVTIIINGITVFSGKSSPVDTSAQVDFGYFEGQVVRSLDTTGTHAAIRWTIFTA